MHDLVSADPRLVREIRRHSLGYVSQFLRVIPRVSARDVVAEPLLALGMAQGEARARASDLLRRLNLPERLHGPAARHLLRRRAAAGQPRTRLRAGPAAAAAGRTDRQPGPGQQGGGAGPHQGGEGPRRRDHRHLPRRRGTRADRRSLPRGLAADAFPRQRARMTTLTNARLILEGEVMHGTLIIHAGLICDIQPGRSSHPAALDLEGDLLMPGVVDVHTDNLERQVQPRANARWPSRSAS
jgi:hypothetical protein